MGSTNVGVDADVFAKQGFRAFLERELEDLGVGENEIIELFGKLEDQLASMSKKKCTVIVSERPLGENKAYTEMNQFGSVSMYVLENEDIFIYVPR